MEEVVQRQPRTGQRLQAHRKRQVTSAGPSANTADGEEPIPKRRKHRAGVKLAKAKGKERAVEGGRGVQREQEQEWEDREDEEDAAIEQATAQNDGNVVNSTQSELKLMYNSVRGYVSAVNELWGHQVANKLHNAPRPNNVAIKVFAT